MWVDSLFLAVKEALGLAKQSSDPEVIRLSEIRSIKAQLKVEYKKLDELLTKDTKEETKNIDAIALGGVINRIVELRNQKSSLER